MNRRILTAAGAAVAILLVLLIGAWLARAPIAGLVARSILERRGVAAEFDIERLDTSGLVLRDVRLGDGTVIPRVELDYRLGELFERRLRSIRVVRPQLRVRLDEDGISVAGFRIGGEGGGGGAAVDLVSITNGLVTLVTEAGDLALSVDLEGGPNQGWRGWLTAEEGSAAWRGWGGAVSAGEIEFEMIGDGLLARAALTVEDLTGPRGAADLAMVAATMRLEGLEQGFANARGQAALATAVSGASAVDPEAEARRLIAADRWGNAPGAGRLAPALAGRIATALQGFSAQAALLAEISPATVSVVLENPVTIDSEDGPDVTLRPMDDAQAGLVFTASRTGGGWRAQASADVTGGPDLAARALDVRFADGLSALRFEGDLAPFGEGESMLGAERLSAQWERTPAGWRLTASGLARFGGAAFGLVAQDAAAEGRLVLERDGGAVRIRPVGADDMLDLRVAAFQAQTTRFEGLSARFSPVIDAEGGVWSVAPGDAPVSLSADAVQTRSMRLTDVTLAAPQGGLTLAGRGGVFELEDGDAPVSFTMGSADGGPWSARGVRTARLNGARGPLLQRTESGETFLNAQANAMQADSFALDSGTTFRSVDAADVRLNGPVSPEMAVDAVASSVSAILDTLGRTDMALTTGEMNATLSAAADVPLTMRFGLAEGALEGASLPVALSRARVAGRATFGAELQADVDIENAVVAVPGERPVVTPATLSGGLTAGGGVIRMDMTGEAEGAPPDSIVVDLVHDLNTGLGEANVDVPRMVFAPGGPQPQDIIAPLKGLVADVSGPAEAHFRAQWYGNAVRSSGVVVLDNLDIATRFGPVQDVSTRFEMSSLSPLLTPSPQAVTMGEFNPGVPVRSGEIVVSLLPEQRIGLEAARWPFAGGEISVQPFVWNRGQTEHRATLQADRINLAQLVGMFDNDSINAGGTVSGEMPIVIREGNIIIDQATLTGDDEGFVSYRGQASEAAAAANEQASLAFRALENLQYRVLEATLNGPVAGEMDLTMVLEGFNPDVLNGFPFRFRIGVSADFVRLLRDTTQGFRIREQIERSLQNGGEALAGEAEGVTTAD